MSKPFERDTKFGRFNELKGGTWADDQPWERLRDWSVQKFEYKNEGEQRRISLQQLIEGIEHIEKHGMRFMLDIPEAPQENMLPYQPKTNNRELLKIITRPLPDTRLLHDQALVPTTEYNMFHISLCFTNELCRFNLYDKDEGINTGYDKYMALKKKYDGKVAHVEAKIHENTIATITAIHTDAGDLFQEPDLHALHYAGEYYDRPVHISL